MTAASIPAIRRRPTAASLRLVSDDRLSRLAAKGDQRAFASIYERYHQPLYRYCRSILRSDEDAADALQNTMARVLRALPGEEREIALKPWLYRIAQNEALRILSSRRPEAELDSAAALTGPSLDQDVATRERLDRLVADLGELPERQRSALVMRELGGVAYDHIAAALDISAAAAKQTVYEARTSLQEAEEGREMDCDTVGRSISAHDRRRLRGRKVRAHLRHCGDCRGLEAAIRTRRSHLAAIAPPLPAAAAAAMLDSLLGGGGGSSGSSLLGLLTGGAGKAAGAATVVKGAAVAATAAVAVTAGAAAWPGGAEPASAPAAEKRAAGESARTGASAAARRDGRRERAKRRAARARREERAARTERGESRRRTGADTARSARELGAEAGSGRAALGGAYGGRPVPSRPMTDAPRTTPGRRVARPAPRAAPSPPAAQRPGAPGGSQAPAGAAAPGAAGR